MSTTESSKALKDICMSGGAEGSDLQWGYEAGKSGQLVAHFSFKGHRTNAPSVEVIRLSDEQMALADDAVRRANRTLKRSYPGRLDFVNNLLRRNWYQIKDAESVYAITSFDEDGVVKGGTAWAIQMYLDRFIYSEAVGDPLVYLYDTDSNGWYKWGNFEWHRMNTRPPKPSGVWAGIGTRSLPKIAKIEIRRVMGTFVADDNHIALIHPTVDIPEVNKIIYLPQTTDNTINCSGGWATINRVIPLGDDFMVSTSEIGNVEFSWNEIREKQDEMRHEFGLIRAVTRY